MVQPRLTSPIKPLLKLLLKRWTQATLAALLCASAVCAAASPAAAAQGSVTFQVNVVGTCQLSSVDAEGVTLRCTQGFSPADPRTVISVLGRLPAQPLALADSQPAADGGTLNRYSFAVSAGVQQEDQQAGWATFY